jgi:hypothetical protein
VAAFADGAVLPESGSPAGSSLKPVRARHVVAPWARRGLAPYARRPVARRVRREAARRSRRGAAQPSAPPRTRLPSTARGARPRPMPRLPPRVGQWRLPPRIGPWRRPRPPQPPQLPRRGGSSRRRSRGARGSAPRPTPRSATAVGVVGSLPVLPRATAARAHRRGPAAGGGTRATGTRAACAVASHRPRQQARHVRNHHPWLLTRVRSALAVAHRRQRADDRTDIPRNH